MAMDALATAFSLRERAERVRRISLTFGKIYLGIKTNQWVAKYVNPQDMERRWSRHHRESARAIYKTAIDLRGLILKGCQFIGSRADIVPTEYVEKLSLLQDKVPHHPFSIVRDLVEEELGAPLREIFSEFAETPVAAASLAQVHEARLQNGDRVAVKVQYPEIAATVNSDLANLRALFAAVGLIEEELDLIPLLDELGTHVPKELDFLNEAKNAHRFAEIFEDSKEIAVPYIYDSISSEKVLVMEFIDGIKIGDRGALVCAGFDPDEVMRITASAYAEQILRRGFFHADPHPGNLLVRERGDGDGAQVVFLDFGLAKELPPGFHAGITDFTSAIFKGDASAMAEALIGVGFKTRTGDPDSLLEISRVVLASAIEARDGDGEHPPEVQRYGRKIVRLVRDNPIVEMPSHVYLLGRVLGLLTGLAKNLGVRTNLMGTMLPYLITHK
jgi:predicted unusual protein kinase regulating ubiquinone biosynthesis (AarF/ABC1/UbiB family)